MTFTINVARGNSLHSMLVNVSAKRTSGGHNRRDTELAVSNEDCMGIEHPSEKMERLNCKIGEPLNRDR